MPRRHPAARLCLALALCATPLACGDAPTLPTSFVKVAGGSTWVAVAEPRGLPDTRSWLGYLAAEDAARARALLAQAEAARRAGGLEPALRLEAQARLFSAGALATDPPAGRLRAAAAALDEWQLRAGERLAQGVYPALAQAREQVLAEQAAARAQLEQGYPREAALHLARGGEAAREFAPERVALRLVEQAEQRIDRDPAPSAELRRARLLLSLAREAMASGDQTRALRRAWYALQLMDADAARHAAPAAPPPG